VDEKRFAEFYESGRHASRVKEDLDEGGNIGISETPANILLNNRTGDVLLNVGALHLRRQA
jgi:hypothetical protein